VKYPDGLQGLAAVAEDDQVPGSSR
jgi:hypothetical protein